MAESENIPKLADTDFDELPLKAKLSNPPWSSDYWASVRGGTSLRWQLARNADEDAIEEMAPYYEYQPGDVPNQDLGMLSPTEKLDLLEGDSAWTSTRAEQDRTLHQRDDDGSPRTQIPEWEGLSHAWAAASLQFPPVAKVNIPSKQGLVIPFAADDVYALLSLQMKTTQGLVLARRCEQQISFPSLPQDDSTYAFENAKQSFRQRADEINCPELNPAAFHVVLANQIGRQNEGFIIDRQRGGELSNVPVAAYESRIVKKGGKTPDSAPGTDRTVQIKTVVYVTADTPVYSYDEDKAYPYESEFFAYELDLDASGRILAGRWLREGDELSPPPDFLWKPKTAWLNGPVKAIYEKAREAYVQAAEKQADPFLSMPNYKHVHVESYLTGVALAPDDENSGNSTEEY